MSKAVKKVGVVLGAVALIATGVGAVAGGSILGASIASIGAVAGVAAGAAQLGAAALAKPPPARGSVSQLIVDPNAPQPYVMGEGYFAGVLRHRAGYGGTVNKIPNPYLFDAVVYSGGGPVQSIAPRVDFGTVPSWYSGYLFTDTQVGACPESSALAPHWAGVPGWGASSKLSGQAAIGWSFQFDKEGKKFASGLPQTGAYLQGVKVYDPRLDDTQPGGEGACRLGDESTYIYSANPALHAGTYAYGRYQNGKRTLGMGLPADAIDWPVVALWATTCEANGWTLFGVAFEPGDRWQTLTDICMAGGAEPIPGAVMSFRFQSPKVALDTVTEADLADEEATVCPMQSYRDRINMVIPVRRNPAQNWELSPDAEVAIEDYIEDDGEERPLEWPFNFVKDADQAAQLAAYRLVDAREIHPIELVCMPRLRGYRAGDCLHLDLPQLGLDHDAILLHRDIDPATMKVRLTFMSETPEKHAFALGQSGTAPPVPALVMTPEDRDETAWENLPAEGGATVGAPVGTPVGDRDAEDVTGALDQFELDMAAAESAIDGAESDIATAQGQISGLLGDMADAQADILAAVADIGEIEGDVATLSSTVATQGSAITTNATAISGLTTNYGNLTQTVRADTAGTLPSTFAQDGRWWTNSLTGQSPTSPPSAGTFETVAGVGRVYQASDFRSLAPLGYFKPVAGRRARVRVRARCLTNATNGGGTTCGIDYTSGAMDASFAADTLRGTMSVPAGEIGSKSTLTVADGWVEFVRDFVPADPPNPWMRPRFYFNYAGSGGGTNGNSVVQVELLEITPDVTDVVDLGAEVSTNASALATLGSSMASLTDTVDTLGASVTTNATAITEIEGDVADLDDDLGALQSSYATLSSDVSTLGSDVSSQATAISILDTDVGALQTNYAALTQTVRADTAGTLPSTFAQDGRWWTNSLTGQNPTSPPAGGTFVTVTGVGRVYQASDFRSLAPLGYFKPVAGRRARVRVRARCLTNATNGGGTTCGIDYTSGAMDAAFAADTLRGTMSVPAGEIGSKSTLTEADGWVEFVRDFVPADPPNPWMRPRFYFNYAGSGGGTNGNSVVQVELLEITPDVTDVMNLSAEVSTNASALATLGSQYASLDTLVTTQGASIATNADAISDLTSDYASLETDVSAQGVTVSEHTSAIAAVESDVAVVAAQWGVQIDVDGRVVGLVRLDGTDSGSLFEVLADVFRVTSPTGEGLTWNDGILWNKGTSTSVILGQDFGATSDLLLWAGPNPASAAAAAKGDGVFWIDNAGNAYFGGFAGAQDVGEQTFAASHNSPPSSGYLTMGGGELTIIPASSSVSLTGLPRAYGYGFGTGNNVSYRVKWQYSADKSTWTDVGSASATSTWLGDSGGFGTPQDGAPANVTKTGLTAGVLAHFRVVYEITAGGALIDSGRTFNIWVDGSADGR